MGHASVDTTKKYYCDIDDETVSREVLQAFEEAPPDPSVNSPLIYKKNDYTGYA